MATSVTQGALIAALLQSIPAYAAEITPEQIKMIQNTAVSICTTVQDKKGKETSTQIEGDVKAQVSGLIGKFADFGGNGKGSITQTEFEGLTRDATAAALEGDRGCKERVFNKMFDKITSDDSASSVPIIPDADSGWVGGGTYPDVSFCDQQLFALSKKYPSFAIEVQKFEGHNTEFNPLKHDIYRYQCSFSAKKK